MKHTKSPWWVDVQDEITNIESEYQTIATEVSNCDAALILAAPELLAALQKIVNNWDDLHPKDRQQARAAIAKATGKEGV